MNKPQTTSKLLDESLNKDFHIPHSSLCQCIMPEYLPNEHGDMTCIKCGHYPNPVNPFANIL